MIIVHARDVDSRSVYRADPGSERVASPTSQYSEATGVLHIQKVKFGCSLLLQRISCSTRHNESYEGQFLSAR